MLSLWQQYRLKGLKEHGLLVLTLRIVLFCLVKFWGHPIKSSYRASGIDAQQQSASATAYLNPTRQSILKMDQFPTPSVNGPVPYIADVKELCDSTTVTIFLVVRPEVRRFHVPKTLICAHSAYFRAMFTNPVFEEATSQKVIIREQIHMWAFITFVQWMSTQRLILTATPEVSIEELLEDGDAADPRTWPYSTLFSLYAMADFLDSIGMRRLIIQQVQIKMRSIDESPRPSYEDLVLLQQLVPESSPLRQWIAFDIVVRTSNDSKEPDDMVNQYSKLFEEAGDEESLAEFHRDINLIKEVIAEQSGCSNCGQYVKPNGRDAYKRCSKRHHLSTARKREKWAATCMFHEHTHESEYKFCKVHFRCFLKGKVADWIKLWNWDAEPEEVENEEVENEQEETEEEETEEEETEEETLQDEWQDEWQDDQDSDASDDAMYEDLSWIRPVDMKRYDSWDDETW